MLMVLVLAAFAASDPFPLDPAGDADLARLQQAWQSPATDPAQRGELAARLRDAAGQPSPDWGAVAGAYFAWRNAAADAENAHWQELWYLNRRAAASVPKPSSFCTTETSRRPDRVWGGSDTRSTTTCYRSARK